METIEDVLGGVGFSSKEAKVYLYVLANARQTATEIASGCGEKRSNTYMILESLTARGVVMANDETAVRTFAAAHPSTLKQLLRREQERQNQLARALNTVMPKLTSQYTLAADKPGVVHMQGADGFMTLLKDMVYSKTEVLLVASNDLPSDADVLKSFRKLLVRRKQAGVKTRALFHQSARTREYHRLFAERGIDVRFLGTTEFTGEVVVYEDNVAFTVYEPSLMVTVITNRAIAATMRILFEELWAKALRLEVVE